MTWINFVPDLANFAVVLMVTGFAFRNPLMLRGLAVLGSLFFILHYYVVNNVSLWTALVSSLAIIAVNIFMIWKIIGDRRKFRLSAEELMLFARLPGLTPGQFKQLLDISEWHNPKVPMQLTTAGTMPDALYYVLEGRVEVNRENKRFSIGPHAFIGELAFLRKKPATATTFAAAGGLIVSWEQAALRHLMLSQEGIGKALDHLLSGDMAEKIATSAAPFLQEHAK